MQHHNLQMLFSMEYRKNTSDRILKKAKQRGLPKDIIDSMERIEKEKDELYAKLKKANKK